MTLLLNYLRKRQI